MRKTSSCRLAGSTTQAAWLRRRPRPLYINTTTSAARRPYYYYCLSSSSSSLSVTTKNKIQLSSSSSSSSLGTSCISRRGAKPFKCSPSYSAFSYLSSKPPPPNNKSLNNKLTGRSSVCFTFTPTPTSTSTSPSTIRLLLFGCRFLSSSSTGGASSSNPTSATVGSKLGSTLSGAVTDVVEIDCNTNQLRRKEIEKGWLCQTAELRPRDLRLVWPPSSQTDAVTILARGSASVVYLAHTRAVIMHDRVLLFQTERPESQTFLRFLQKHLELTNLSTTKQHPSKAMQHNISALQSDLPFELDVLEAMLMYEYTFLTDRFQKLEPSLVEMIRILPSNASQANLEYMLQLNTELVQFEDDASQLHNALKALLYSDRDLDLLNLTQRHEITQQQGRSMYADNGTQASGSQSSEGVDHTEVEILLENYTKCVDALLTRASTLTRNIRNCEKMVEINLDCTRNRIMQTELKISIGAFVFGTIGVGAGFFGMNLYIPQAIAESHYSFPTIIFTSLTSGICLAYGIFKYCKYRKILMPSTAIDPSLPKPLSYLSRKMNLLPTTSTTTTASSPLFSSSSSSTSASPPMTSSEKKVA